MARVTTLEYTPEEITVSGVADENAKTVRLVAAGEQSRETTPAADDAIIASIAAPGDNLDYVQLIVTFEDSAKQTIKVPVMNLRKSTAEGRAEAKRLYPNSAGVKEFEALGG